MRWDTVGGGSSSGSLIGEGREEQGSAQETEKNLQQSKQGIIWGKGGVVFSLSRRTQGCDDRLYKR